MLFSPRIHPSCSQLFGLWIGLFKTLIEALARIVTFCCCHRCCYFCCSQLCHYSLYWFFCPWFMFAFHFAYIPIRIYSLLQCFHPIHTWNEYESNQKKTKKKRERETHRIMIIKMGTYGEYRVGIGLHLVFFFTSLCLNSEDALVSVCVYVCVCVYKPKVTILYSSSLLCRAVYSTFCNLTQSLYLYDTSRKRISVANMFYTLCTFTPFVFAYKILQFKM